jgi:hypothetical protein
MAHWAELDDNNIVLRVTVGDNNDPNGDEGYQWLIDNIGGRWIKTSYNNTISSDRKQQVGLGMRGDKIRTYRFQDDVVKDHNSEKSASVKKVLAGNFDLLWKE